MPLYEYQCEQCEHRFEVIQKYSDAPIAVCPKCGGPVVKLMSSPAIQFKGSGFYITDYARKGDNATTPSSSSPSSSSSATAETKTETKTEAKPETKADTKKD
jgi:putative FmdB family regulatory protein